MRALNLDFAHRRRPAPLAWLALVASLALATDAAIHRAALADELERAEQSALAMAGDSATRRARAPDPALARDSKRAEQVMQRLALPWDELFRAVEAAGTERVALLALQPDSRRRELNITGEAADFASMLAYVERLGKSSPLHGVHLLRHETRQDDPQHPILFTVAARWVGSEP